jgi:hypothetical protein
VCCKRFSVPCTVILLNLNNWQNLYYGIRDPDKIIPDLGCLKKGWILDGSSGSATLSLPLGRGERDKPYYADGYPFMLMTQPSVESLNQKFDAGVWKINQINLVITKKNHDGSRYGILQKS